ncbi:unnamed protein product [Brachionus calyciflorus]|uniref:Band 7 domain-containing protein n=1 Tax=Brachionus calyciflorus TaxID=104777 RepID=A0A813MBR7_9BILA|nr:unnamed protein product [Brachionus calyciflorus]
MKKAKYQKVNKIEHEILIDDLNKNKSSFVNTNEKAFDFTSINDYNSIFNYKSTNSFLKYNNDLMLEQNSKDLNRSEKFLNFTILTLFYAFFLIFLPFSLFLCLKKVRQNERLVVYRLGRLVQPAYQPGYYLLFPFIDSFQRHTVVQKELCIPNLQILSHETAIIELSTVIRYQINDVIKVTNSLQDSNALLRSLSRGILISIVTKKALSKLENEKNYIAEEFKNSLNENVKKWGIEILMVELTINGITKEETPEGEDPALKTLSLVFKSLFGSSDSETGTSSSLTKGPDFLTLLQGMTPFMMPNEGQTEELNIDSINKKDQLEQSEYEPFRLLKLIQPLLTETLIKEINVVYEFHIKIINKSKDEKIEIFHLDMKNNVKNRVGLGQSLFSKSDCIIKMSDEDLKDLLNDKLKPFTAYLSGRIEIDGDLQDVFKLKKLIKLVPTIANKKNLI